MSDSESDSEDNRIEESDFKNLDDEVEPDSDCDENNKTQIGSYVIVQLKGKKTMFHYVARVESEIKNKHCINVTYLKKSNRACMTLLGQQYFIFLKAHNLMLLH